MASDHSGDVIRRRNDILFLFDVDNTVTKPRQHIDDEMDMYLQSLRKRVVVGLCGGSDLNKIAQQTIPSNVVESCNDPIQVCVDRYDYVFAENGLVSYEDGQLIEKRSLVDELGNEKIQRLTEFCSTYMDGLTLPTRTDNFIEIRTGLINVCPPGRSCNQEQRDEFTAIDKKHRIREKFVEELENKFGDHSDDPLGLEFMIGGQISIDVFPKGWNKTYCLRFLDKNFKEIHFFGDKTDPGGNDHAIYIDERTIGHTVQDPAHTLQLLKEMRY